jgi:putative membrane protein
MKHFLVHWFSTVLALLVCSRILPGVHVDSYTTLAVAALVLGFINAIIRPILLFLALPITVLTLGLFYFVVNGLAFALAAWVVPGFDVDSIVWAILGSIVVTLFSWFLGSFGRPQAMPER